MMFDIFINDLPSQPVSDCTSEVAVFPKLARPKPFLNPRELAEQFSRAYALYCSYHLTDRTLWWKRYQYMHMILRHFHFLYLKSILLAYFPNQLSRSFPYLLLHKYVLSIFWTPHQVVHGVVDRMTRPLQSHAYLYTTLRKGLCGLGRLSRLPNNPPGKACIHPRGKPRGILQSFSLKEQDGPEIQVHGSGSLIQTLLKHNIVDELWLKIFPITLGRGKRLFAEGTIPVGFKLIESGSSPGGVIIASYVRAGEIKTGSFALESPTEAEFARRKRLKEDE